MQVRILVLPFSFMNYFPIAKKNYKIYGFYVIKTCFECHLVVPRARYSSKQMSVDSAQPMARYSSDAMSVDSAQPMARHSSDAMSVDSAQPMARYTLVSAD